MKVEIFVTSKELIKPSSPTPDFLRKHELSFIDQLLPDHFMPSAYFYPADGEINNEERSSQLKRSLSEVLTRFYPLAGRIVGNDYVDCNDEGVEYFEAKITNATLSEFIYDIDPHEVNKLHPHDLFESKDTCMAVQVSFFNCGGMALALIVSHKVADAMSHFTFANSWAAIARGKTKIPYPKFNAAANIFPPVDGCKIKRITGLDREEGLVTKTFLFPHSKINALRDRYADSGINDHTDQSWQYRPTRYEVITAFLWSHLMGSAQRNADPNKIYAITVVGNMRKRFDPPLSEEYFGNMSRPTFAVLPAINGDKYTYEEENNYFVIEKLKEAKNSMNRDFLAKYQAGKTVDIAIKGEERHRLVTLFSTTLCGLPLYEADFGWGRPIRFGLASYGFRNRAIFIDTPDGGIEVWLSAKEEDMAKFEADMELCEFISH